MGASPAAVCFVIMPFGRKPIPGDGSRLYDFEKVYNAIVKRAVALAGLTPLRADECAGSGLIHTDMFTNLRDQPVVVADLSLENANVFYELGVRHVMTPAATVLMHRRGTPLPFDVGLARVIEYEYDGASLDYDEVERVVPELQRAVEEAYQERRCDSPVHSLLEPVVRFKAADVTQDLSSKVPNDEGRLAKYERIIAQQWISDGRTLDDLRGEFTDDVFGCRCLGHYCLCQQKLPDFAEAIADRLREMEQFELAKKLYEALRKEGRLTLSGLQDYASTVKDADPHGEGVEAALRLIDEARHRITQDHNDASSPEALRAAADCQRRLAGFLQWRWRSTGDDADLDRTIEAFAEAVRLLEQARSRKVDWAQLPGAIAWARLRYMFLLRAGDRDPSRRDDEGNLDAVLRFQPTPQDDPAALSWLHWYQAIAIADSGQDGAAQEQAAQNLIKDAELRLNARYWQIGRWQYRNLRRFIEQNSPQLRDRRSVEKIARTLLVTQGTPTGA